MYMGMRALGLDTPLTLGVETAHISSEGSTDGEIDKDGRRYKHVGKPIVLDS